MQWKVILNEHLFPTEVQRPTPHGTRDAPIEVLVFPSPGYFNSLVMVVVVVDVVVVVSTEAYYR